MKSLKDYEIELDYLIISNIVNSDEKEIDIVNMIVRYVNLRHDSILFNIQNPRPVGDETDTINLHRDDEE